jgi:hypothetical protein
MSLDTAWPALPLEEWRETYRTLHMYTQVVGKIRLALAPMMNHWWQTPLYVTTRGLTTSPIAYGDRTFELTFDFFEERLIITVNDGEVRRIPLGLSVHDFYFQVCATLASLGFRVSIWPQPVEVVAPVRFDRDRREPNFDGAQARRFFQALSSADRVFKRFRAEYTGKVSPVHFFWGSFDLAVTRFSGRPAPERQGDRVSALSYNAELASVGFWPGGDFPGVGRIDEAVFYAYSYPKPEGLERVEIPGATWNATFGEFVLPYERVRHAQSPDLAVLKFARAAFEAGARLAGWPVGAPVSR